MDGEQVRTELGIPFEPKAASESGNVQPPRSVVKTFPKIIFALWAASVMMFLSLFGIFEL